MKQTNATLWAVVGLVICGVQTAAQAFKPFRIEMTAYRKTDNRTRQETSKIWMKALDKFRIEQEVGAQKVVTIANGRDVWEVRTINNVCFHSKESADKVLKIGKQTANAVNVVESFKKQGGKPAGQQAIDGMACKVFRRKDKQGMTYTLWVQPDGRIRRIMTSGVLRGALGMGEPIEYHQLESRADFKWLPANNLDEALFRAPAGMAVTERAPSK